MIYYENIIIGAGPAGLQLAYFFEKSNIPYIILEKSDNCASFFNTFPHSSELISINKKYTGNTNKDFNLRHDWNSLLNDENFLFNEYTEEFYPNSKYLFEYLNDFYKNNNLKIKFNTHVKNINKNDLGEYLIEIENYPDIFYCKKLIIGTGLSLPNIPQIKMKVQSKNKILHYGEFDKNYFANKENLVQYKNKKVLIIGSGNSAYELANILNNYTSSILILGNTRKFSIVSHYAGDLRSINYKFFDTFYLKSLNAIDNNDFKSQTQNFLQSIEQIDNKNSPFHNKYIYKYNNNKLYENDNSNYFDEIIFCTGWKFDTKIFNFKVNMTLNNKYPSVKYNYESDSNDNLFFIGSLMHSLDYRKSSGGFIHGFRYLIKLFVNMNYNLKFDIKYFKFSGNLSFYDDLTKHIMYRINNSSSLYQMFGIMCDLFYYDDETKNIFYHNDLSLHYIKNKMDTFPNKFNILMLNYGPEIYDIRNIGDFNKKNPSFIHPEILLYENSKHIDTIIIEEDLFADFSSDKYYDKILRTLKSCNLLI
jgi:thioredoxin reductase